MAVHWLAEEADRAGRLRALADTLFGEGGNEDNAHSLTAGGQLSLKFQPAYPWHLDVRNKA